MYIIAKTFRRAEWRKGRTLFHTAQLLSVYIVFVTLLMISHLWFVLGVFGLVQTSVSTPLLMFWYLSWMVYFIQLLSAETVDRTISLKNIFTALIMYVTYAQLWIILLFKGMYLQFKERKSKSEPVWDKTVRF